MVSSLSSRGITSQKKAVVIVTTLCILRARAQQHQLWATGFLRQKHIGVLSIIRLWSSQVGNKLRCSWYVTYCVPELKYCVCMRVRSTLRSQRMKFYSETLVHVQSVETYDQNIEGLCCRLTD